MSLPMWEDGSTESVPPKLSRWDTLILSGYVVPGVAEVSATRKRRVDPKSSPGSEGANQTDLGSALAEIDIKVTIWTASQLTELEKVLHFLTAAPQKTTPDPAGTAAAFPNQGIGTGIGGLSFSGPNPAGGRTSSIKRGALKPMSCRHPNLELLKVRNLYILEVSTLNPGSVKGTRVLTMKAREFLKPNGVDVTSTAQAATDITKLPQAIQTNSNPTPSSTDTGP